MLPRMSKTWDFNTFLMRINRHTPFCLLLYTSFLKGLFERQLERRERERSFLLLVPQMTDDHSQARPYPGTGSVIQISDIGGRNSSTLTTIHCFSRSIKGSWSMEQWEPKPAPMWDAGSQAVA